MNTGEKLSLITLIATIIIGVVGFAFTFYQIRKTNKVKQAEFVSKLLDNIRFSERCLEAIYIIDYNNNWYNQTFHNSGDMEKNIDALFSQIDYVCYLYNVKLLCYNDFSIFKYDISRICSNYQCRCYLWNLYHWAKYNDTKCSFDNLVNYLKSQLNENELLKFESNCETISKYRKYLTF